jgi:hypothetical protein
MRWSYERSFSASKRLVMDLLKISDEVSRRIPREQLANCKTIEELWSLVHAHVDHRGDDHPDGH